MADYELIGLNEAAPDLRAPTSADRGVVVGGVLIEGLAELDGGADIDGVRVATVSDTNPLARAIAVQMTAAASGSNGIQQLDNDNLDMGTNDFTLVWKGSLPDWTPASFFRLIHKIQDSNNEWRVTMSTTGQVSFSATVASVLIISATSTVAVPATDGEVVELAVSVVRETALAAGSVAFYANGVQFGDSVAIPSASTVSIDNTGSVYWSGTNVSRNASVNLHKYIYNRALTAAEVLDLSINGVALADRGASQTPLKTFDFSAGADGVTGANCTVTGNIDGIGGVDNTLRAVASAASFVRPVLSLSVGRRTRSRIRVYMPSSNVTARGVLPTLLTTGNVPVAGGTQVQLTPDTWTDITQEITGSGSQNEWTLYMITAAGAQTGITIGDTLYIESGGTITQIGLTSELLASNAQSNTGQILDSSGNRNHALLPASGATVVGRPVSQTREVRWTNTWAGTNELQYIGGVNQAIIPANAYIESIIGTVTGATPHDIIVGDGSDADRYVTITTGLAAGTISFTLANRTTDGTNLKLTVDPDTNATMSIAWVISYRTLES